nr:hypothetical protein [uncultured archaeon]
MTRSLSSCWKRRRNERMPGTQVLTCPECGSKVRISVRDDGEITVLDSEELNPLEELERV